MSKKSGFTVFFLAVVSAALVFRLIGLGHRPMHHDEANQAVKFGVLLEEGEYRYDPAEHHGPTLYYLTLPFAWVAAGKSFAAVDEATLRLVPAVFGVGTILLFLLFRDGISRAGIFFSGLLAAVSPVFVYFNRFYIQESILVFSLAGAVGCGWGFFRRKTAGWAAASGLFCGLMFATKETSVILFGCLAASLALARLSMGRKRREGGFPERRFRPIHLLLLAGTAAVVSSLFYSSFFRNPRGILDAFLALGGYLERAAGNSVHAGPWYEYLRMLAFFRHGEGPVWSEAFILVLALVGAVSVMRSRPADDPGTSFRRFVLFFTILATAVYSAVPYKTPWNVLPFFIGWIIIGGEGAALILRGSRNLAGLLAVFLALGLGFYHLGIQCYRANFPYASDPRNPYVYAQTTPDFLNLVDRIREVCRIHTDRNRMLVKVITSPDEAWPLPWYLRDFERVGYWQTLEEAGGFTGVPVIVSSLDEAEILGAELENTHQAEHYGLRPGVLLVLFTRNDLWKQVVIKRP